MPDGRQHHLVAIWNPSVMDDAMDAHVEVLLQMARESREGKREAEDVYVWWGKVRSPNRQRPLPHLDEILKLDGEAPEDEFDAREMHLYLTDYRSLYVGQLGTITADDMATEEPAHTPAYYAARGLECDCWFQLWDLRRLVHDDTLGVVAELKKLRNTRYNDRPVSLYGGMVDLPLVVHRDDGIRFFDAAERDRMLDGKYWVEFDAANAGLGALERDLRDNLFGEAAWTSLDVGTRTFVTTAERIFRDNRASAAFDFAPVLSGLAKALEIESNRRMREGLVRSLPSARHVNIEGRSVDVTARALTLGQLARALGEELTLRAALAERLHNAYWFTGAFPPILRAFAEVRNEGIHADRTDRATAVYWRDRLTGVGCEGVLVLLAGVRIR